MAPAIGARGNIYIKRHSGWDRVAQSDTGYLFAANVGGIETVAAGGVE